MYICIYIYIYIYIYTYITKHNIIIQAVGLGCNVFNTFWDIYIHANINFHAEYFQMIKQNVISNTTQLQ